MRLLDIAAKFPEAVHARHCGIEQFRIVKHFTRLVLLGADMVIDGVQGCALLLAGESEIDGRFAAVAANFQHRSRRRGLDGGVIKGAAFLWGQETLDLFDIQRHFHRDLLLAAFWRSTIANFHDRGKSRIVLSCR